MIINCIKKQGRIDDYLLRYNFSNNLLDEKGIYNLTGVGTQAFTTDRNSNLLSAYNTVNSNWASYPATQSLVGTGSFTLSFWAYIPITKMSFSGYGLLRFTG